VQKLANSIAEIVDSISGGASSDGIICKYSPHLSLSYVQYVVSVCI